MTPVLLQKIALQQTPAYVYDLAKIRSRARVFQKAFPRNGFIQYAMKANSNPQILRTLKKEGIGLDVVSGGELRLGLKLGFSPRQIVFSGVGKSDQEIEFAIRKNIRSINVESFAELNRILLIAHNIRKVARLSLRVNPNVNAKTHRHITTGRDYNKFGLSNFELKQSLELLRVNRARLQLIGITFHLGSQIPKISPYIAAFRKVIRLVDQLIEDGFPLEHLSIGGGMPIAYDHEKIFSPQTFGAFVRKAFKDLPIAPMCEPGRILVGDSGVLLTRVRFIKDTGKTKFAIVDTGMHHLLRPALYDAYHEITPLNPKKGRGIFYEVVGPICESTDVLGRHRKFADLKEGDVLVIQNAGAYGRVMANEYNLQPLPPEFAIDGKRIRKV